eukprot:Lankesteria_metandrocarpae@DN4938_c0_g1_i6.p1
MSFLTKTKKKPSSPTQKSAFYDGMICPLSLVLLTDPVIASDGESYDATAMAEWLRRGAHTSPVTGQPLEHQRLIRNNNLSRSTVHLVLSDPQLLRYVNFTAEGPSQWHKPPPQPIICAQQLVFPHFATNKVTHPRSCGDQIVCEDRQLAKVRPHTANPETATHTSLFQIGFTTRDPEKWSSPNILDLLETAAFFYDASGYVRTPSGDAELVEWPNARHLVPGNTIHVGITPAGNFWLSENSKTVIDFPAKAPTKKQSGEFIEYWGFVTLFGVVKGFRLLPSIDFQGNASVSPVGNSNPTPFG